MNYKAIIFDMDGTIIESEHIWIKATADLLKVRNITVDEKTYRELRNQLQGIGIKKSCQLLKDVCKIEDSLEYLVSEKTKRALDLYRHEIKFIEGFTDFHLKVSRARIKSGIATNADQETVEVTDKKLNLKKYFGEHIYHADHVAHKYKPDPDLYLHVAEKLKVHPHECIAIEDSAHGVAAAKNAGMTCIGINSAQNRHLLKESDRIIDRYDELDLKNLLKK